MMELEQLYGDKKQRKKPSADLATMAYGKVPPQAIELEQAVLGAVMIDGTAYTTVSGILKSESFYNPSYQQVFKSFERLSKRNAPIDLLTVVEELKAMDQLDAVGGAYAVTKLTNNVVSTAHIEGHANIIKQKYTQRELIRIASEIIADAYEDSVNVSDLLQRTEKSISAVSLAGSKKNYKKLDAVLAKLLDKVETIRHNKEDTVTGVPTGIGSLDHATGGWQPTDFIVIAARPSIGKSAVAGNLARNAALHPDKPTPVGIFSLEMSDAQWAMRILSAESNVGIWNINRGKVTDEQMEILNNTSKNQLGAAEIFIDDTAGIDVYEFKSKVRKMVLQDKVGLIIVDYLQLMSGTGEKGQNREQEVSTISRNIKALAKELQVPIIALSQLSRGVEKNGTKPRLSDLRESGAIEQDADVVMFLIPVDEDDVAKDPSLKDSIHVRIAKHRNGTLEDIELKFLKEVQKIMSKPAYDDYIYYLKTGLTRVDLNTGMPPDELPF